MIPITGELCQESVPGVPGRDQAVDHAGNFSPSAAHSQPPDFMFKDSQEVVTTALSDVAGRYGRKTRNSNASRAGSRPGLRSGKHYSKSGTDEEDGEGRESRGMERTGSDDPALLADMSESCDSTSEEEEEEEEVAPVLSMNKSKPLQAQPSIINNLGATAEAMHRPSDNMPAKRAKVSNEGGGVWLSLSGWCPSSRLLTAMRRLGAAWALSLARAAHLSLPGLPAPPPARAAPALGRAGLPAAWGHRASPSRTPPLPPPPPQGASHSTSAASARRSAHGPVHAPSWFLTPRLRWATTPPTWAQAHVHIPVLSCCRFRLHAALFRGDLLPIHPWAQSPSSLRTPPSCRLDRCPLWPSLSQLMVPCHLPRARRSICTG